jgi:hypothetical protein
VTRTGIEIPTVKPRVIGREIKLKRAPKLSRPKMRDHTPTENDTAEARMKAGGAAGPAKVAICVLICLTSRAVVAVGPGLISEVLG